MPTRVPPEGPLDAKIAFVGEAPGEAEVRLGRPFVGSSGKLLDQLLLASGINRRSCYLTNVVKERPNNNDISKFIKFKRSGVEETAAFREYREELFRELANCQANVIVPLGRVPLWALYGRADITKRRGSILAADCLGGRKLVPTIHPAAALRQYLYRHTIFLDLQRAARESAFPAVQLPGRSLLTSPTAEEAIGFLQAIQPGATVGVDIEVFQDIRQVSCLGFATAWDVAMCIPLMKDHVSYFTVETEREVWDQTARILADPGITKIIQNAMFECSYLWSKMRLRIRNIQDTMVAHAILFPDFRKGLDFMTSTRTKEPYYKDEGKMWKDQQGSYEQFWRYNCKDAALLMELWPGLLKDLETQGNLETYNRQMSLLEPMLYIQAHGIAVDHEGLDQARTDANDELGKPQTKLTAMAGRELNPNSPVQLKKYFYEDLGQTPYYNKGKVTTDDTALTRLARKGIEEAGIIKRMRKLRKLVGTYFDMDFGDDKRCRGAINIVGTTTGRVSSSKTIEKTGGNLQNQPPAMRKFLVADPGYVIYNIDMSQIENRIVAHMANEPTQLDAFETGKDMHSITAAFIFNKPVEDISREKGSSELGTGELSERDWGKKANHAYNYGLGYKAFALLYELPESEGRRIYNGYHNAYPTIQAVFWRRVQEQLKRNRTLVNLYGRKRMFLDRMGPQLYKEAYAFVPQSTTADHLWTFGVKPIWDDPRLEPVQLMNCVHDSIVIQLATKWSWCIHSTILNIIKESLETPLTWRGDEFVVPADVGIGQNHLESTSIALTGNIGADAQQLEQTYETVAKVLPRREEN